jgi:hypothetical protein
MPCRQQLAPPPRDAAKMSPRISISPEPVLADHAPSPPAAGSQCPAREVSAPHCCTEFIHMYQHTPKPQSRLVFSLPLECHRNATNLTRSVSSVMHTPVLSTKVANTHVAVTLISADPFIVEGTGVVRETPTHVSHDRCVSTLVIFYFTHRMGSV